MKRKKYDPTDINLKAYDFNVELAVSPATDCVCGQPLTRVELKQMSMTSTFIPESPDIWLLRIVGLWDCPVCGETHERTMATTGEKTPIAELYEYILATHR